MHMCNNAQIQHYYVPWRLKWWLNFNTRINDIVYFDVVLSLDMLEITSYCRERKYMQELGVWEPDDNQMAIT